MFRLYFDLLLLYHMAFIAFGGPPATPQAPLSAEGCQACTL